MTAMKTRLIEDAKAAGFTVTTSPSGMISVLKRSGRWNKVTTGLCIYPDGTACDARVDLAVAKGLRSDKDMRKVLGI